MYKITDGTEESDIRYFETGGQEFSFVWVGDFHAYSNGTRLSYATKVVNDLIDLSGNTVDFILSAGDIVAHGGTYAWWKQVSEASWIKNYMFAATLGNHDWMTSKGTEVSHGAHYSFFDACSNYPRNGFGGQENICYYFYYGDALFVVVNTESQSAQYLGMTTDQFIEAQKSWVRSVLDNNTAQYIFLMQHYQAFGTNGSFNSAGFSRWSDICDEYGIDIFFTGNSHVYMRTKSIYNGQISTDQTKGTVYMVASSSDHDRGVDYKAPTQHTDWFEYTWSDSKATAASLIKVSQNGISIRTLNEDDSKGAVLLDSGRVLPKRGPSERVYRDLSNINKEEFEKGFAIQVNQKSLSTPKFSFPSSSYDVIKSMKIYNKETERVYFDGPINFGESNFVLKDVEKGKLKIAILLRYFDNTEKELLIDIDNNYKWGSITNEKLVGASIEWKSSLNDTRVSSLELYKDNEFYKELGLKDTSVLLDSDDAEHTYKLVLKDIDGDIVYESIEFKYPIIKYYTVTFVDEDGNTLKTEIVKEGSTVTAPSYSPKEGYEFKGWDKDFSIINSDLVIKVVLEKISEEVTEPDPIDEPAPIDEPDPIDNPDPVPTPAPKSGCSKGTIISLWTLIIPLGLVIIIRRRFSY